LIRLLKTPAVPPIAWPLPEVVSFVFAEEGVLDWFESEDEVLDAGFIDAAIPCLRYLDEPLLCDALFSLSMSNLYSGFLGAGTFIVEALAVAVVAALIYV
jgi:hypothetical protein